MSLTPPHLYNTSQWYSEIEQVRIDRTSMLAIVGAIEVALMQGSWHKGTEKILKHAGRLMASRLLAQGYMAPGSTREAWAKLFGVRQ